MPLSFGRVTLAPELPAFFERYPEISLELHFSDSAVDLIAQGFELAVRTGNITDFPPHHAAADPRTAGDGGGPALSATAR